MIILVTMVTMMAKIEFAKNIVGKTIKGVVVKESDWKNPRSQIFLLFDDNTYYEFYSASTIRGIHGIDKGGMDTVKNYMPENKIILEYEI